MGEKEAHHWREGSSTDCIREMTEVEEREGKRKREKKRENKGNLEKEGRKGEVSLERQRTRKVL